MEERTPYFRDAAVSAIRSFYKFLTTLPGLLPSAIKEPPPSGWPDVDTNTLAPLKKNNAVIDLLRHIPYIDNSIDGGTVEIAYKTLALQYNWPANRRTIEFSDLEGCYIPISYELPDYVVALTKVGEFGSWLLLDTQEGTVTDYIMMERPERNDPPMDHPDNWRAYQTLPIIEFFNLWKENYRSLKRVVLPDKWDMDGVRLQQNKATDEIRDIYRAHGWPSSFRFQKCKDELLKLEEKRRQKVLKQTRGH